MVNFHCIAEGCSNDSRKKHNALKYPDMILNGCIVDFHVLPSAIKNPKLRKLWLSQIRREGFNPDPNCHWHALCSRHFIEGRPTKENAVPTLFAYNNYKTGTPRDTKNIISYIEKPSLDHTYCLSTEGCEDVSTEEKCVLLIENNNTLEQKCQEENKILNEKFNNTDELLKDKLVEKLTKSDSNVKCFLRLPSISMLFGIFKLLAGHASKMKYWMGPDSSDGKRWQVTNKKKPGASRKLTFFEEFIITLLRSITERSGFIDLIEKGDHVMADRGFLIKDLLLSKGATLNMPTFTRPCKKKEDVLRQRRLKNQNP
ncbi:unnamed protein product [Mytilus coruscus]|uniref:THAP-type domain-containing protein n=1 Tax=Mytilus coruscus TaxID=42192 RepID=A0A6J8E0L7_MYTCO|nr:unnamed protein product [Mytilus coruscus]